MEIRREMACKENPDTPYQEGTKYLPGKYPVEEAIGRILGKN